MCEGPAVEAGRREAKVICAGRGQSFGSTERGIAQKQGQSPLQNDLLVWTIRLLRTSVYVSPADLPSIRGKASRPDQLPLSAEPQRLFIGAKAALSRIRVPDVDFVVIASGGCYPASIRAEGASAHSIVMPRIGNGHLTARDIVNVHVCQRTRAA